MGFISIFPPVFVSFGPAKHRQGDFFARQAGAGNQADKNGFSGFGDFGSATAQAASAAGLAKNKGDQGDKGDRE